jgi:hypothetical protein
MADRITYVGLDVHKESIVIAAAEGGLRGEVREHGRIANTQARSDRSRLCSRSPVTNPRSPVGSKTGSFFWQVGVAIVVLAVMFVWWLIS